MPLKRIMSRWRGPAPQPTATDPEFCGPPRPLERRERFALRRLQRFLVTVDFRAQTASRPVVRDSVEASVRTSADSAA